MLALVLLRLEPPFPQFDDEASSEEQILLPDLDQDATVASKAESQLGCVQRRVSLDDFDDAVRDRLGSRLDVDREGR